MSTPADNVMDDAPQSALATLSPEGRTWGANYLKEHPEGVDTRGEEPILKQYTASAEEARAALQAAREKLAAQRMDPRIAAYGFAQAMLAPAKYGLTSGNWANAAGSLQDYYKQQQDLERQKVLQDVPLAEQQQSADKGLLNARLALQELKERNQAQMLGTALKATARPEVPPARPHFEMVEHDVTLPDGTPGKQSYVVDSSTGKITPYGTPAPTVKGAGLDARSGLMFQRVLSSANEAAAAIKNVTELPTGASSGWFGVGASPGHSLMASAKGVLTNKLAPQEVQDYLSMMPGLNRNLATIETAGLAPQGSLTGSFDTLQLREGDTGYTKLHKLAEYRQIVEKGIETNLSNPKIPPEQKEAVRQIIDTIREAIPFTQHDVTALQRAHQDHPEMTLADYLQQQGLGKKPPAAATGAPVTIKSDDDYNALPSGALFVGPDGHTRKKP